MTPAAGTRASATLKRLAPALLIVGALLASVGFAWRLFDAPWYQNHDMLAYPVRAVEYVAGWKAGALWPRWAQDLYGGYGSPLFNYYAPGLFVAAGVLMLVGASAVPRSSSRSSR